MTRLQPGELAWIDQQDTRLRNALNVVLHQLGDLDLTAPTTDLRAIADQLGTALATHVHQLDPDELELLALTAVIRLAERIHTDRQDHA